MLPRALHTSQVNKQIQPTTLRGTELGSGFVESSSGKFGILEGGHVLKPEHPAFRYC